MPQPRKSLNFYLALLSILFYFEEIWREPTLEMTISATALSSCTFSPSWCLYNGSDTLTSDSEGHLTRCWTPEDLEKCFRQNSWRNLHLAAMPLLNCRVSGGSLHTFKGPILGFTHLRLCRWPLRFWRSLDGYLETDFSISNQAIKMQAQIIDSPTWSLSFTGKRDFLHHRLPSAGSSEPVAVLSVCRGHISPSSSQFKTH